MRTTRLFVCLLAFSLSATAEAIAQVGTLADASLAQRETGATTDQSIAAGTLSEASIDVALRQIDAGDRPHVIVRYRPGAGDRLRSRLESRGEMPRLRHQAIGALSLQVRGADIARLRRDPDVLGISLDAPLGAQKLTGDATSAGTTSTLTASTSTTSTTSASYDLQGVRRTLGLTSSNTGYGVGIAVIDSGISPMADIASRITAFYDFTTGTGPVAAAPSDGYGHGTHIAGLIAGSGQLSSGRYVGMATSARLIGLKVLDANGQGYTSNVISALEFAIANKAALGIDIVNLSLGHPILEAAATDPLVQAVEAAVRAGIVVVASAGNHGWNSTTGQIGYAGITSPGNAPSALTVGSLRTRATVDRSDDEVSPFSSRGPTWYDGFVKPDVLAPGQALVAIGDLSSTLSQNAALRADVTPYLKLSGTSMAAAVATGVVADIIEANRADEGAGVNLTPNTIKAILQFTAIHVPNASAYGAPQELAEGAGAINGAGAILLARAIKPVAAIGNTWLEYGVDRFTSIAGITYSWTQHIVWGDHIIWGDTILWNEVAWAEHIVWGASDDQHIVWGDAFIPDPYDLGEDSSALWGTQVIWGNGLVQTLDDGHIVWGDLDDNHVVWGDSDDGHVVWGNSLE